MQAIDILRYKHELRDAGTPENQAIVHAKLLAEMIDNDFATKQDIDALGMKINELSLSTKADINTLSLATKADINALSLATKADFNELSLSTKANINELSLSTKADINQLGIKVDAVTLKLAWLVNLMSIVGVMISFQAFIKPYLHF